jgi:3-hydroxyisobutyrate dehydrogenase
MYYGLIGTGLMGYPLAEQICGAGFPLTVYNRTPEKATGLVDVGATVVSDAGDVLKNADCIVMMLTDAPAVRETVLTESIRPLLAGRTLIQMGTINPQQSCELAAEIQSWGGEYLEAPVLGSIPEARTGELLVMVGASPEQWQRWLPLLQCFGADPQWVGPVGSAMALKLAMNQLIGSLTTAFALSLGFVQRHQVDVDLFMQILRHSALYAPTFDKKLKRMLERQFANPNFPSKHLAKDMRLFQEAAAKAGLKTDSVTAILTILDQTLASGAADQDYSALFATISPAPTPEA